MTNRFPADFPIYPQISVNATQKPPRLCAVSRSRVGLMLRRSCALPPPYFTLVNPCGSRMEGTLGGRLSAEFSTQKPRAIAAPLSVRTREPQRLWDSFPCRRALPVSLAVSRAQEIAPTGTPPKGLFALHRPV